MQGRRLYKTKLCMLWQRGHCSRLSCTFAHGEAELRHYPSAASFPHGRHEYRSGDLRDKLGRRYSPPRRYSGREPRFHHSAIDRRPISHERGSSLSRSPVRNSERRHGKQITGEESDSSGSLHSDDHERKKEEKLLSYEEMEELEDQLKQVETEIEDFLAEKSQLEILLDQKIAEAQKFESKVVDLESQLSKEQDGCQRVTSILKKFSKAHSRHVKAQEELKRSQSRLLKLGDSLVMDNLKLGTNEEDSSVNVADDDQADDYTLSSGDKLHARVSSVRKRSFHLSNTEDIKLGNGKKEGIVIPDKNKIESAGVEPDNSSKRAVTIQPFSFKHRKMGNGDRHRQNIFAFPKNSSLDKPTGHEAKHQLPSTSMAARAVDELVESIQTDYKAEQNNALAVLEKASILDSRPVLSFPTPPIPPPVAQSNTYEQCEGDDEEVNIDKFDEELIDFD